MLIELRGADDAPENACVLGTTEEDKTGTYVLETGLTMSIDLSRVQLGLRGRNEVSLWCPELGSRTRSIQLNGRGIGEQNLPGGETLRVVLDEPIRLPILSASLAESIALSSPASGGYCPEVVRPY